MKSKILNSIREVNGITVRTVARQHNASRPESNGKYTTPLDEMAHLLLDSLATAGQVIFDDDAQFNAYQNILAALHLANQEPDSKISRSLQEYSVERPAKGDYNPLGELGELQEPTIKELADRYHASSVISEDWNENPALHIQIHLGTALLELGGARFPLREAIELNLLAAMVCVDKQYEVETVLKVEMTTQTFSGPDGGETETEVPEMVFKQRRRPTPEDHENV